MQSMQLPKTVQERQQNIYNTEIIHQNPAAVNAAMGKLHNSL